MKLKAINKQYFDPSAPISIAQHHVELWPGYKTTIRQTDSGMALIADVIHKVLRTGLLKKTTIIQKKYLTIFFNFLIKILIFYF
jgi:hypothetical protein